MTVEKLVSFWPVTNLYKRIKMNYEKDLEIDPDAIDVAWIDQSMLLYRYKSLLADARKKRAELSEKIKIVRSQLIKEKKEEDKKVTGVMIEAYYRDHPKHKKVKQELINSEYEVDLLDAAVWAIQHKKTALENLVRLLGMDYFSSPSDPRNLAEEISQIKAKKTSKKLRRRKK